MTAVSNRCQSFPAGASRERPIPYLKYLIEMVFLMETQRWYNFFP
jgi:hypothetical protein